MSQNANMVIEAKLNQIENYAFKKFENLKHTLKTKIFDQINELHEKMGTQNFVLDASIVFNNILSMESALVGSSGRAEPDSFDQDAADKENIKPLLNFART